MNIFNTEPANWIELQNSVGQLFQEIGFDVEISKKVELVRGSKEIDVLVVDTLSEFRTTFLIECKNWNKPVNQETVHAFHTVLNDYGANFGFIVSKNGFQSGSFEAAKKTNINLVSLKELEERFYHRWQQGMVKKYMCFADRVWPYWDFAGSKRVADGKKISWETKLWLNECYNPFIHLGPGDIGVFQSRKYPINLPIIDDSFLQIGDITLKNDRDFFNYIEEYKDICLRHYQIFYHEIIL